MKTDLDNENEWMTYREIVESFFTKNYPDIEKDKFWKWILLLLTGRELDVNALEKEELREVLKKLNEFGNVLFDPLHFRDELG
jgi:hypothetical protein